MSIVRWISGVAAGALVALGIAVAPALGASDGGTIHIVRRAPILARSIGSFTPASADPRLAALFARGGLDTSGFRFTPSDTRPDGNRAVTVAIQARSARGLIARVDRASPLPASTVALTPIAYNLGVAVGWRRLAVTGDVAKVDLAGIPGSRESADVGVSYTGKRFSGRVKAAADRPISNMTGPVLADEVPAYSLDVGGSYALTRRLDVTAGVRYKTERDLMTTPSADERRDSRAVYIGTAFRF